MTMLQTRRWSLPLVLLLSVQCKTANPDSGPSTVATADGTTTQACWWNTHVSSIIGYLTKFACGTETPASPGDAGPEVPQPSPPRRAPKKACSWTRVVQNHVELNATDKAIFENHLTSDCRYMDYWLNCCGKVGARLTVGPEYYQCIDRIYHGTSPEVPGKYLIWNMLKEMTPKEIRGWCQSLQGISDIRSKNIEVY